MPLNNPEQDAAPSEKNVQPEPMGPPKPSTNSTAASPSSSRAGSLPPRRPRSYNKSNRYSGIFGNAGSHALTNNLAASRAPSNAPRGPRPKSFIVPPGQTPPPSNAPKGPRPKSVMLLSRQAPSRVSSGMGNLELNGSESADWRSPRPSPTYDPSMGPTQSTATNPRPIPTPYTQSQYSKNSRASRLPFSSQYCKLSGRTRFDYRIGDLISAPFHVANTNPKVDPSDQCLTLTIEGPVYSKRRMLIVLFIHAQDMYCLPLYSFSDRGLEAKPEYVRDEYVCVANEGDRRFVNPGRHKPVQVAARRAVNASTTLHLAGGIRVGCNEDVFIAGRVTRESYFELKELWEQIVVDVRESDWDC